MCKDDYYEKLVLDINNELYELFENREPKVLYEAMAYSVNAGGKRLRPVLLLAACECVGGNIAEALPFACALELIHTYSLIHDDLPSMDNDDLRRGKPTNHVIYGEAMAILAGDGLLNMAYEIMCRACAKNKGMKYVYAMSEIASAAGAKGMVGGQAADIAYEDTEISEDMLMYIHKNKTGRMICAAVTAGAILGNADDCVVEKFRQAGELVGCAFQIKDDILDLTGDVKTLGKSVKSDEKNKKSTYVSMFGLEKAEADFETIMNEAVWMLEGIDNTQALLRIMETLFNRDK